MKHQTSQNEDQLGFDALLADADTDNRARHFEQQTAHLPASMEEAVPTYRAMIEGHHTAMMEGDVDQTMLICDEAHLLAQKLNDGEPGILAHDDAPGYVLTRQTAAKPGSRPLWGQTGKCVVEAAGMRVCIELDGMFGIGANFHYWPGFAAHARVFVERSV